MANTIEETAESYQPLGKPERVDREKGIIYGVRACGRTSRNGGKYPREVQARDVDRYNGLNVYVDMGHHQIERGTNIPAPVKFGYTANAKAVDGGIDVDLHFIPTHDFAKDFCWACENDPRHYGFSHFADVKWDNRPDGSRVAESIRRVVRLDIVGDPATTTSVFESKGNKMDTPADPRTIAAQITSPDALKTFLAGLFDGLPSGTFNDAAKATALADLVTKYGAAGVDPATNPTAAAESLRQFGKVGEWAGTFIAESIAAAAKADRIKKAGELCDAEKLPLHLKTSTFVELVAESMADPAKAKALIADRLAIGKPTAESRKDKTETHTTDRTDSGKDDGKSVSDILKEMSGGKRFAPSRN